MTLAQTDARPVIPKASRSISRAIGGNVPVDLVRSTPGKSFEALKAGARHRLSGGQARCAPPRSPFGTLS
jgi:hypothetical protein